MGTSLTGTKIRDTYDALIKVSDNGALDGTLQVLTDGLGNNSALSLSTAGASVGGTLAVSGAATFSGALNGTLSTAAQPNITSVGTLSSLSFFGGASSTLGLSIEPSGWGGSKHRFTVPTSGDASVLSFNYNGSSVDSATYGTSSLTLSNGYALISTGDTNQAPTQRFKVNYNGDISFRDSSANESFYWDASAASLGIGTNNPDIFGRFYDRSVGITSSGITKIQLNGSNYSGIDMGKNGTRYAEINASDASLAISTTSAIPVIFYTNNAERMRIDSSGNLLVGVTTGAKFSVSYGGNDTHFGLGGNYDNYITAGSSGATIFRNSTTERMRIDSSGNVGIGIQAPTTKLYVNSSSFNVASFDSTFGQMAISFRNNGTTFAQIGSGVSVTSTAAADDLGFGTAGLNKNIVFATGTGFAERMRITSAGEVLVGKETNARNVGGIILFKASDSNGRIDVVKGLAGATSAFANYYNNAYIGGIDYNDTTTSFLTSSDYRLKEDWVAMEGALDRVDALKPINFAWKSNGSRVDGFLAHELAEVVPEAVTGEKDATEIRSVKISDEVLDEEGNVITEAVYEDQEVPLYQGIDQSKIVPLLVAAIQELNAKVESLEAQLNA